MYYDPIHSFGVKAGGDEVSCLLIQPLDGNPLEASVEYALAYADGMSAKAELQLNQDVLQTLALGHQVLGFNFILYLQYIERHTWNSHLEKFHALIT